MRKWDTDFTLAWSQCRRMTRGYTDRAKREKQESVRIRQTRVIRVREGFQMDGKRPLTKEEIAEIVRGLGPVDWVQVKLLAALPSERRIIPALQAQEFSMAGLRGTFLKRFPGLILSEINMKVLAYLTPVRMEAK